MPWWAFWVGETQRSHHPVFSGSSLWCWVNRHWIWSLCGTQQWAGDYFFALSIFLCILSTCHIDYTSWSFIQLFAHKDWRLPPCWALCRAVRWVLTSHCDMRRLSCHEPREERTARSLPTLSRWIPGANRLHSCPIVVPHWVSPARWVQK